MTWSIRRPPPRARLASMRSASGRYPAAASARGCMGGRPQSWPRWLNASGGAPTVNPGAKYSCPAHASAPPGCAPIARSAMMPMLMPADRAAACAALDLRGDEPLHPGVELGLRGEVAAPYLRFRRPRVAQPRRPGPVVGPVDLGERAPGGPVVQRAPVPGAELRERRLPLVGERHLPQHFQRLALGRPDRVPVDQPGRPRRVAKRLGEPGKPHPFGITELVVLRDVLDAEVERRHPAAAHRQVGRRADRGERLGGVQRVDQHEPGAQLAGRPGGQVGEVPQVTVAPGAAGAQRVELHGEPPRPLRRARARPPRARGERRPAAARFQRHTSRAQRPQVQRRSRRASASDTVTSCPCQSQ